MNISLLVHNTKWQLFSELFDGNDEEKLKDPQVFCYSAHYLSI
jgi:hypothetical protein